MSNSRICGVHASAERLIDRPWCRIGSTRSGFRTQSVFDPGRNRENLRGLDGPSKCTRRKGMIRGPWHVVVWTTNNEIVPGSITLPGMLRKSRYNSEPPPPYTPWIRDQGPGWTMWWRGLADEPGPSSGGGEIVVISGIAAGIKRVKPPQPKNPRIPWAEAVTVLEVLKTATVPESYRPEYLAASFRGFSGPQKGFANIFVASTIGGRGVVV